MRDQRASRPTGFMVDGLADRLGKRSATYWSYYSSYGAPEGTQVAANGALLWVWIGLMNPTGWAGGFAHTMPLAMISAVLIVIAMAAHPSM